MRTLHITGKVLATLFVMPILLSAASAQSSAAPRIEIIDPFVRATPGGARVGAGYLKIRNAGDQPDRLVGVESAAADSVMIHNIVDEGGIAKMRHVDGLMLAGKSTTELAPGGLHLMFMAPRSPFKPGDVVKATLLFEKAGKLEVMFEVKPIGAQ